MAINKTWIEGSLARASVAYTTRGEKRANNVPRYEWSRIPGPRWEDLFGSDSLAQYTSSGTIPTAWTIAGGKLIGTGGTLGILTKSDLVLRDCEIEINCDQAAAGGIVARYQDDDNFYLLYFRDDTAHATQNLKLYKMVSGTWVDISDWVDVTWIRAVSKTIKLTLHGSRIEVWFDGVYVIDETDTAFKCGKAGIYNNNATAVQVLDLHIYQAVQGILAEEGTTNLLTANQSNVETDTSGFGQQIGTETLTRVTTEYYEGSASLRTVTPGGVAYEGFIASSRTAAASQPHTASAYVKGSGTVQIYMNERDAGDAYIGETASAVVTLNGCWQRISVSRTFGVTGVNARIKILTSSAQAITFYADCLQIEQKAYTTQWQIGGTARSAEDYTLSSSVFKKGNWSVKMIYLPSLGIVAGLTRYLFSAYIDASNFYALYITSPTGLIRSWIKSGGTDYVISSGAGIAANTAYSIELTGNGSVLSLYVNGSLAEAIAYTEPAGNLPVNAYIGCDTAGTMYADGIVANVGLGYARTLAEHQADYATGKPLMFDAKTTALMPLDGHLKAYTRRLTVETVSDSWVLQPTGGVILDGSDLPVSPDFKKYSEEADQLHGELDFGGILQMRKFDFIVDARKANADKYAYLRDLAYWLNPCAGFQELIWDDDPIARCMLVRVTGGISYANKVNAVKFRVPLEGKPFMESLATKWEWLNNSSADVENEGNEEAPLLITFYDAAVNPSITINGVAVTYTGSLVAGDYVTVDTGNKTAIKNGTTNVLGSMGANWPLLQPGWNYITSTFFCSVQWRDRWI